MTSRSIGLDLAHHFLESRALLAVRELREAELLCGHIQPIHFLCSCPGLKCSLQICCRCVLEGFELALCSASTPGTFADWKMQ